jgi:hypothetical protein
MQYKCVTHHMHMLRRHTICFLVSILVGLHKSLLPVNIVIKREEVCVREQLH